MTDQTSEPLAPSFRRKLRSSVLAVTALMSVVISFVAMRQQPHPDPYRASPWNEIEFWLYPIEHNAHRRLPLVNQNIYDVHSVPETTHIWAVGDGGLILHSSDAGRTWERQRVEGSDLPEEGRAAPPQTGRSEEKLPDADVDNDKSQHDPKASPSGGREPEAAPPKKSSWLDPVTPGRSELLREPPDRSGSEVQFHRASWSEPELPRQESKFNPPASSGTASTPPPRKAKAQTPGITISQQKPYARALVAVFMQSASRGWATDDSGFISTTTNGRAWRVIGHCGHFVPSSIYFFDENTGFVFGNGRAAYSFDSGRTWDLMPNVAAVGRDGDGVVLLKRHDDNAAREVEILRSRSVRAREWSTLSGILAGSAVMAGGRAIVISDDAQSAFVSTDGENWRSVPIPGAPFPPDSVPSEWTFTQPAVSSNGFILTYEMPGEGVSKLYVSTDGQTWALIDSNAARLIDRTSGASGVIAARDIAGSDRFLLARAGTRSNWTVAARLPADSLAELSDSVLLAVIPQTALSRSTDGGRTWHAVRFDRAALPMRVGAIDSTRAWLISTEGKLYLSSDTGRSWRRDETGSMNPIVDAALTPSLAGVAVTSDSPGGAMSMLRKPDSSSPWAPVPPADPANLLSSHTDVRLFPVGKDVWAISPLRRNASIHAIFRTSDAGKSWTRLTPTDRPPASEPIIPEGAAPVAIGALADGSLACLLDPPAIIRIDPAGTTVSERRPLSTRLRGDPEPGETQELAEAPIPARLLSISNRGIFALNAAGTLLRSKDLGESWSELPEDPYSRTAAPWYFVAMLLLGAITAWSLAPSPRPQAKASIGELGVSDDPIEKPAGDRLRFAPLARGVAYFLINPKTQAPLTLAVTGPWGVGKSSLMRLIRTELRAAQFPTIWFNAWHQQSEQSLLASLLESIRRQAAPSMLDPQGWLFRVRLLTIRLVQRFRDRPVVASTLALLTVAAIGWALVDTPREVNKPETPAVTAAPRGSFSLELPGYKISGSVTPSGPSQEKEPDLIEFSDISGSLERIAERLRHYAPQTAGILALLGALLGPIRAGLVSFGVDPGRMIAASSPDATLADLRAQTSFRERFAKEFEQVTAALGEQRKLVLFIDDLDRCDPAKVVEMLQAANYLVTAGRCVIIMGFAPDYVRTSINLQYADLIEGLNSVDPLHAASATPAKRRDFAINYLEKLVNIEIPVPDPSSSYSANLIAQAPERPAPWWHNFCDALPSAARVVASVCIALLLIAGAYFIGHTLVPGVIASPSLAAITQPPQPQSPARGTPSVNTGTAGTGAPPAGVPPISPDRPGAFAPPDSDSRSQYAWIGIIGAAISAFALAAFGAIDRSRAEDTPEFRAALRAWFPLVDASNPTPREIKRYLNRVRFYAMRQRANDAPDPWWRVLFLARKTRAEAVSSTDRAIDERILVALSAIEQYNPECLAELRKTEDFRTFYKERLAGVLGEQSLAAIPQTDQTPGTTASHAPLTGSDQATRDLIAAWRNWLDHQSLKDDVVLFVGLSQGVTVR